ncbi:MAG TPA: HAMP domain-containing sensor histidine kinase [Gemmatimonadaceae bacterium]
MTADGDDAAAYVPAKPLLDALEATRADGLPRNVALGGGVDGRTEHPIDVTVCRGADGRLVLGLPNDTFADANESLRQLARQLAAERDSTALLETLSNAATAQCAGSGAGVLKTVGNEGELVAAVGSLRVAFGRRFALPGSLVREVLRTRDVVAVADFSNSARPLATVAPELRVGPMLLAPLIAHGVVLGVLTVTRDVGDAPFSKRESRRLRSIADYAALAVWKTELLEQAQAADRAKGRFLATVSHELRTPLTALAGYEELLVDQVMGPLSESQMDVLERMRSVTHHLASVIEEVLTYSSLEEGREKIRPTDFLAADLVQAAAAVIEPLARQKRLIFAAVIAREPIRLTSDVDKVRQILVNLAGNAVKFTESGEIHLEVKTRKGEVWFTVRDTGIGIPRKDIDRLFQPFSQLDNGLTRRHGGTGLGLYICRGLAELLGGRIVVESEVGKGSAFTLVLPGDEM